MCKFLQGGVSTLASISGDSVRWSSLLRDLLEEGRVLFRGSMSQVLRTSQSKVRGLQDPTISAEHFCIGGHIHPRQCSLIFSNSAKMYDCIVTPREINFYRTNIVYPFHFDQKIRFVLYETQTSNFFQLN